MNFRAIQRIVVICGLAVLAACSTYSLEELRHTPPRGTPFQAALAVEYLRFAEDEAHNVDWPAASYFSEKGLRAAYGQDVAPESLDDWRIPPAEMPALTQAHNDLTMALTPEHTAATPEAAARAQIGFDCWVKGVDGGWSQQRIQECRDWFKDGMREVASADTSPLTPPEAEPLPPQAAAYIVLFANGKAALDQQASSTVEIIAGDIKKEQHDEAYTVVLNGHTDTVGSAHYNLELSQHRAESVKQALIAKGIPAKLIRTFGFGKTDLAVATPDNTPEPRNRRVEIYLGD